MTLFLNLINNGVVRVVLLGTISLGLISGVLGVFTLLRKQALIGDALSHSTLPGVVLMFILTSSKNISVLIIGAAVSAAVAMGLMRLIKKYSILENDSILALVLSSFFGFGRFLISLVSRYPEYSKVKLDDFIFGSAATIIERDLWTLFFVSVIVFLIILSSWKNIKLQTFNSDFYDSIGFSSTFIEFLMSFITILVIVVGIRSVGVILMSALLITPGLAARQWSDKLGINVILSGIFGSVAAFIETLYSVNYPGGMPTGPVIVIVGTIIFVFSILFSPKKGLIAKEVMRNRYKKDLFKYENLINLSMGREIPKYEYKSLLDKKYISFNDKNEVKITEFGYSKLKEIIGGEN